MPKYSNKYREEFMADLDKLFNALDPTGTNTKWYHDFCDPMSDKEFDDWVLWLHSDLKHNFYWEVVEYERPMKLEYISKAAKLFNISLYERVCIPHINGDRKTVIVTPDKVPVGWAHIKRLPQTIHHKNSGSVSIEKRNSITNQVIGADKNGKITDVETYALTAYGANNFLREMLGFRADDEAAKDQAYSQIVTEGVVYLNDLESYPEDKVALNTLDTYYTGAGMKTNLVSGTKLIASPRVKMKGEAILNCFSLFPSI